MGLIPFNNTLEVIVHHPKSNFDLHDAVFPIEKWVMDYEMIPHGSWPSYVPLDAKMLSQWGYALNY